MGLRVGPAPIVGVLSVVGPSYRLDEQRLEQVGAIVSREALALSERFGSHAEVSA